MKPNGLIDFIVSGKSYHNAYGEMVITPEQLAQGIKSYNSLSENERRLPVKYGKHDQGTDAAGWIVDLVGIPADAPQKVVATVEWNEYGSQAIKDKRQRYISPEFAYSWMDAKTGKKGFAFLGAALLNDPHMTELAPAIAFDSGGTVSIAPSMPLDSTATLRVQKHLTAGGLSMEVREKLCTMLGIESTADDDALFNAMQALRDKAEGAETEIEVKLSAAVAPKDSKIVELSAKVETQTQEIDKLKVELSAATEAAAAAANEKLALEADTAVEALIKSGKALPRERELLLSAYKKDPEGSKALWELRGEVITFAATGINDPVGGSIEDRQVAAYNSQIKLGKSAEDAHAFAASIQ